LRKVTLVDCLCITLLIWFLPQSTEASSGQHVGRQPTLLRPQRMVYALKHWKICKSLLLTVCKDDCYLLDSARGAVYADDCQDSISSACLARANSSTRYRSAPAGCCKELSTCLLPPPGTSHQSWQPAFKHREVVA
jgi:hypothetical protein